MAVLNQELDLTVSASHQPMLLVFPPEVATVINTVIAPDDTCAGGFAYEASPDDLPAGASIHWQVANGELIWGQGRVRMGFRTNRSGTIVLTARIEAPGRGSSLAVSQVPALGVNWQGWNDSGSAHDRNLNGSVDVIDLLIIEEACR